MCPKHDFVENKFPPTLIYIYTLSCNHKNLDNKRQSVYYPNDMYFFENHEECKECLLTAEIYVQVPTTIFALEKHTHQKPQELKRQRKTQTQKGCAKCHKCFSMGARNFHTNKEETFQKLSITGDQFEHMTTIRQHPQTQGQVPDEGVDEGSNTRSDEP